MSIRSTLVLVLGLSIILPGAALAQGASGATAMPVPSESGRPDLYLEMPSSLAGSEPHIVITRGPEHFASLDPDDQTRLELQELLGAVGADIEDMTSGYALVSEGGFFSFVVAIRVEGAEPGTLLPAYLPLLHAGLVEPEDSVGVVGGKDVIIITSIGDDGEHAELFVYDQGDTIWMTQGPREVIEITLENLPAPIAAE